MPEQTVLPRVAGTWSLWGIGVSAVIAGDIAGWNSAIATAGWGGVLLATVLLGVLYYFLVFSLGELAAARVGAGGAYSFARASLGPWGEAAIGVVDTVKYVFITAAVVDFAASYADRILRATVGGSGEVLPRWLWWVILFGVFVAFNSVSTVISLRITITLTALTVAGIVAFAVIVLASQRLDLSRLFDVVPTAGQTAFLPHGPGAILQALPFAIWFFLCIEAVTLAKEETREPITRLPRAAIVGMITVTVTAALVFLFAPAVIGASATAAADEPLVATIVTILPGWAVAGLGFSLLALFASLQGVLFAASRSLLALSRASVYPGALARLGTARTPWAALVATGVIGIALLAVWDLYRPGTAGTLAVNVTAVAAVGSYLLQLLAFAVLRRRSPDTERPYRSPVGVWGAIVAAVIAALIGLAQLLNRDFRPALTVTAVCFIAGIVAVAALRRWRSRSQK